MADDQTQTEGSWALDERPKLRPVSATAVPGESGTRIVISDPARLSPITLSVSEPVILILSLLDGCHTLEEVREGFEKQFGQPLARETLDRLIAGLKSGYYLEGAAFDMFYQGLVDEYRAAPARVSGDGLSPESDENPTRTFDGILDASPAAAPGGLIRGIIAPHLDYPRGEPCYGAAYGVIRNRPAPDRVVILGTNHFGRSTSVCATGKDFRTSLGLTRCDTAFLLALETECGPLRESELDHQREHSIELQVLWLQHLFGADQFRIVPILCPDPCGPTGTGPMDGRGVDLRDFAERLGQLIRDDGQDTLVVAGADLSHVGTFFGSPPRLDDDLLERVRTQDTQALDHVEACDPAAFVAYLSETGNPTNICSAGCIFALLTALAPRTATKLGYHQAVHKELDNCVTCTAFEFRGADG